MLNGPNVATVRNYLSTHPSQVLKSSYAGFFQLPWLPEWSLPRRQLQAAAYSADMDLQARDILSKCGKHSVPITTHGRDPEH